MAKPETKTVTRTIAVPQTRIIKQPQPQQSDSKQGAEDTPKYTANTPPKAVI